MCIKEFILLCRKKNPSLTHISKKRLCKHPVHLFCVDCFIFYLHLIFSIYDMVFIDDIINGSIIQLL